MGPPCGVGGRLGCVFYICFKSFTQEARTRTHTLWIWSQASKRKKSKTPSDRPWWWMLCLVPRGSFHARLCSDGVHQTYLEQLAISRMRNMKDGH